MNNLITVIMLICLNQGLAQEKASIHAIENRNTSSALYTYKLTNSSTKKIVSLRIGLDYANSLAELTQEPVGFSVEQGIPGDSISMPSGWAPIIVTEEGEEEFFLSLSSDAGQFDIAPNTETLFSVKVGASDIHYLNANYLIVFSDGSIYFDRMTFDTPILDILLNEGFLTLSYPATFGPFWRIDATDDLAISQDDWFAVAKAGEPDFPLIDGKYQNEYTFDLIEYPQLFFRLTLDVGPEGLNSPEFEANGFQRNLNPAANPKQKLRRSLAE
jgi:hypothetical protein